MIDIKDKLYKDFEAVRQIPIVSTLLEVICTTTGMGFAAIARVTDDRWLACSVRDEIKFGLKAGGELEIKTTICNEIKDNHKPVIINDVADDKVYLNHHTPKMYGFQSYVSFPIILKNGTFFGTLCAIDPKPAQLNNPKTIGLFTSFVELLSFHLQSIDLMERSHLALNETSRQLNYSEIENRQYQQISTHNLQEPLRKIRLFTDMLINKTDVGDVIKAKSIALKINSFAQEITKMIQEITEFSELSSDDKFFELVDLNNIVWDAVHQLTPNLTEQRITVEYGKLPSIMGSSNQMNQLFINLINSVSIFLKTNLPSVINISAKKIDMSATEYSLPKANNIKYCEILIEDKDIEIDSYTLDKMFDFFVNLRNGQTSKGYVAGLANAQKIVYNHGGTLTAKPLSGKGISFSIILPTY